MARNSIYKIENTVNGKFYIGSSKETNKRFWKHKYQLKRGEHQNAHLQAAWIKYGEDAFTFTVLASFEDEGMLRQFEHSMLPQLVNDSKCYNKSMGVVAPKHTEDTKQLISQGVLNAHVEGKGIYKGYEQSESHKQAISEALKGNQNAKGHKRTDAEVEAIRQRALGNKNWLGKKHTAVAKAKVSDAMKGKKHALGCKRSAETKAKMSAAQTGKKRTDATKAKLSALGKGNQNAKGSVRTDEMRAKLGRAVMVTSVDGTTTEYPTIGKAAEAVNMTRPNIIRALKNGREVKRGKLSGFLFQYVDSLTN